MTSLTLDGNLEQVTKLLQEANWNVERAANWYYEDPSLSFLDSD